MLKCKICRMISGNNICVGCASKLPNAIDFAQLILLGKKRKEQNIQLTYHNIYDFVMAGVFTTKHVELYDNLSAIKLLRNHPLYNFAIKHKDYILEWYHDCRSFVKCENGKITINKSLALDLESVEYAINAYSSLMHGLNNWNNLDLAKEIKNSYSMDNMQNKYIYLLMSYPYVTTKNAFLYS